MNRVDVTFHLPQDLVERARDANLLCEQAVESWLEKELEQQSKLDHFYGRVMGLVGSDVSASEKKPKPFLKR